MAVAFWSPSKIGLYWHAVQGCSVPSNISRKFCPVTVMALRSQWMNRAKKVVASILRQSLSFSCCTKFLNPFSIPVRIKQIKVSQRPPSIFGNNLMQRSSRSTQEPWSLVCFLRHLVQTKGTLDLIQWGTSVGQTPTVSWWYAVPVPPPPCLPPPGIEKRKMERMCPRSSVFSASAPPSPFHSWEAVGRSRGLPSTQSASWLGHPCQKLS